MTRYSYKAKGKVGGLIQSYIDANSREEAIEKIDIGGPSMLRSAAKNYASVAVIVNPERYKGVIEELKKNKATGELLDE